VENFVKKYQIISHKLQFSSRNIFSCTLYTIVTLTVIKITVWSLCTEKKHFKSAKLAPTQATCYIRHHCITVVTMTWQQSRVNDAFDSATKNLLQSHYIAPVDVKGSYCCKLHLYIVINW